MAERKALSRADHWEHQKVEHWDDQKAARKGHLSADWWV